MQITKFKNRTYNIFQKFFIERALELLHVGSIDSYRARVMNPNTILSELLECLLHFKKGRILNFETVENIRDETREMLTKDSFIKFKTFSREYMISLLDEMKKDDYQKVINCLKISIEENQRYLNELIKALKKLIFQDDIDSENKFLEFRKIELIVAPLVTELLRSGFSKSYLYRFLSAFFVYKPKDTFEQSFDEFIKITKRQKKTYHIYFKIQSTKEIKKAINPFGGKIKVIEDLHRLNMTMKDPKFSKTFNNFATAASSTTYFEVKVDALDHFTALKLAKTPIAENLDLLDLGFNNQYLKLIHLALVIDQSNPQNPEFQTIHHQMDGRYKTGKSIYDEYNKKLPEIINNNKISSETKEKIKSAIRYLRLGNEALEVEHKFINYWIGLEYIFSNYSSKSSFNRLKKFLTTTHSVAYLTRNLMEFNKSINRLGLHKKLKNYKGHDTRYLIKEKLYDELMTYVTEYPLLAYRAWKFKSRLFSPGNDKLKKYIDSHCKNSGIHLIRIYRIRNEIVHDASIGSNNENITSNLRYYLTFMLYSLISHFHKQRKKENNIEDFFVLQEIKLGNLKRKKYNLEDVYSMKGPIDFLR